MCSAQWHVASLASLALRACDALDAVVLPQTPCFGCDMLEPGLAGETWVDIGRTRQSSLAMVTLSPQIDTGLQWRN